ncbi:MAG: SpoIIE family protein phosphatase [Zoogloeaceae bacterium]|nr:SpoIIE family protein phosphatase [Zoogloeaceae bacterium]
MNSSAAATLAPAATERPVVYSDTARDLVNDTPSISPDVTNLEVFRRFKAELGLVSLPVVEGGRPVGLINRHLFMEEFARPFARELYQHKSCIAFMDRHPLAVEEETTMQALSATILEFGDKVLADGFIITLNGYYRGMGRAQDVLAAISRMQEEKSRIVMESIDYGSVIQRSISRSSREGLSRCLPEHFLIWEPRDTVSGDLYHFREFEDGYLAILFDCTGHGVPGAFMTLIMTAFMQGAINATSARDPGGLLAEIHRSVKTAMSQHDGIDDIHHADDGMDAAVVWIERDTRSLSFAGAHMSLFALAPTDEDFNVIDGDRQGVGYASVPMEQKWTNHRLELPRGAAVYLFTDGIFDQLGGAKRIAFGKRRVRNCLMRLRDATMPLQARALRAELRDYQGDEPRKDDVSALGFRV